VSNFHGLPTAVLENEYIRSEYLTAAGPSLIPLSYRGSPKSMLLMIAKAKKLLMKKCFEPKNREV